MNAPSKEIVVENSPWQGRALAPAEPISETAAMFQIIERAARDPAVDIDKMERLVLMQERMQERMHARQAELEFDAAMSAAQMEMEPVRADSNNPQTRSRYASYAALDRAIRPIYTKHGFSLSFDTADGASAGKQRIVCKVAHRGGHRERPHIDMADDGKGAKGGDVMTITHATGSAIQYGKRYLVGMIFNLAVSKDDDGNAAGGKEPAGDEPISKAQMKELSDLLDKAGADKEEFCKFGGVASLADISVRSFPGAIAAATAKLNYKGSAK
jgi:hypothetical protein